MKLNIITLFPDYFKPMIELSVVGRAHSRGTVETHLVNLRDFGLGQYKKVDDTPYGGGAGMVLMIEPIDQALQALGVFKGQAHSRIILTSAKGRQYTQAVAREYASLETVTIICGHYEGVDERVAEQLIDEEVRIGDYVLSGGEPAAMVIADSIVRLLPSVLGNAESLVDESHDSPGVLAAPQYTRPEVYQGQSVPKVLLSGDHAQIKQWREDHRHRDD